MLHLIWTASANAGALLAARALQRRLATGQAALDFVVFLVIHLLLVSGAVLVLGLIGALHSAALGLAGAAALALLVWAGEHRRIPRPDPSGVGRMAGILAVILFGRLLFQVWYLAPNNLDALSYHLPKIGEWVTRARIGLELGPDLRSWFPAGFELVEAWWVVLLHHDVVIELAGVEFLLLAFASARAMAASLGAPPGHAFLAGLIFACTPGLLLQSTACMNDVAVAAVVAASAALILGGAGLPLVLLPLGLGAGIKPLCLFALPGLLLLAYLQRKEPPALRPAQRLAVTLAALALAIGSFWYARNLWVHGSPAYPVGSPEIGENGVEQFQQLGFDGLSLLRNLHALLAERMADERRGVNAMGMDLAQWGVTAFSLGSVSLLALLPGDRGLRRLTLALGVSLLSILSLVRPDSWNLRFTWFFPAVLAVAAVRFLELHPPLRHAASGLLLFTLVSTLFTEDLSRNEFGRVFAAPGWRERGLSGIGLGRVPPDPVGCLGGFQTPAYLLYGPDFSRRVRYFRARSVERLSEELSEHPVSLVYGDEFLLSARRSFTLSESVRKGLLRRVANTYWYEVTAAAPARGARP
jgi:hypothetical protein